MEVAGGRKSIIQAMSTAVRVIKNTGWLYAKMGITSILSLVTTRLILNSLGQADFGIYNVVGGAIAMLGFINAAMASTTQRFLNYSEGEKNPEKQKSIFNVSIILHLGIAVLMIIVLNLAKILFFGGVLDIPVERLRAAKAVYHCLVFSTAITIMTAPFDAVITSHENMKYYAIIGVIESVLKLSVALICVYTNTDKLIVYAVLMAAIPLMSLIIMLGYCFKHYSECVFSPRRFFSKVSLKEMGGFAGCSIAMTMTSMVTQYGFGVVLNSFFGVLLNAAHGVASQLSGMLQTVSSLAQKAYNPVLVKREGSRDREGAIYVSFLGCRVSFFLFGSVSIPAILFMPVLLKIWLKTVPEWAVVFARLQLLRILLDQLYSGLNSAILASGKVKGYAMFMSVSYILPLLILPVLFKYGFAPYIMYVVWIFFWTIVGGLINVRFMSKNMNVPAKEYFLSVLFPSLSVSCISLLPFVLSIIFRAPFVVRNLLMTVQLPLFLSLGCMYILKKEERTKILSLIRLIGK